MSSPEGEFPDVRASELATKSLEYLQSGQQDDAVRSLRGALSLAPKNEAVLAAFHSFQKDQAVCPLSKLCQKLVVENDVAAGENALRLLRDPSSNFHTTTATECIELLLAHAKNIPLPIGGKVLSEILRASRSGREHMADSIGENAKEMLETLAEIGGEAIDGLVVTLLDPAAWESEAKKKRSIRDCFKLFLETLNTGSGEIEAWSTRSIARLLATHATELHTFIGQASLERILSMLDIRSPDDLRSHATLATARFVETDESTAGSMLGKFISSRLAANSDDDLQIAFSATAAIFPLVPGVAAGLLLTEGFVEGLAPSLQGRSSDVERAVLEMMSAACVDKASRAAISIHCEAYLEAIIRGDESFKGVASTILAKVRYGSGDPGVAPKGIGELAAVFREMMIKDDVGSRDSAMEGLAYATLKPSVKESLVKDKEFLQRFLETLKDSVGKSTVMYGGLTVVANLTGYLPSLSEEQKRVAQLRNYANSMPQAKPEPDPADKDEKVTMRCKVLLEGGVVPALVACSKRVSPSAVAIISSIFLSLSKNQKHRGPVAQQGGVRLLLQFYASVTGNSEQDRKVKLSSSHALARVLVSTNPSHVFGSQLPVASAVRPLLALLETNEEQNDLLPVFESLLALTNLASTDDSTRDLIIRVGWSKIEETLLSNNIMVQRATMELLCNLMASPSGVAKFADGSKTASNRLHVLLALADAEDLATRRAAGGALAMLTEWDKACEAIVRREKGLDILLGMAIEENEEMRHRGVVCVRNLVCQKLEYAERFRRKGAIDLIRDSLRGARNPEVLQVGVEALKALMEG
ncbi:unnamed protein product [Tuber melanosporum]|uniref:(Perigord truffle) hypothetical protein n=1 Tax=Tuber melanosporum (strain Mel28) TaxID=656061 RepID=D5GKL3_TUBMM|nr:uncharacterized protein GSTUM_00009627001 [Tuber melanosporum]CAZ85056.1 unnamed protein product [Tuber melanosporum]